MFEADFRTAASEISGPLTIDGENFPFVKIMTDTSSKGYFKRGNC